MRPEYSVSGDVDRCVFCVVSGLAVPSIGDCALNPDRVGVVSLSVRVDFVSVLVFWCAAPDP